MPGTGSAAVSLNQGPRRLLRGPSVPWCCPRFGDGVYDELSGSAYSNISRGRRLSSGGKCRTTMGIRVRGTGSPVGAAGRNRTGDLLITNQSLYLLSYCSEWSGTPSKAGTFRMGPGFWERGFEPRMTGIPELLLRGGYPFRLLGGCYPVLRLSVYVCGTWTSRATGRAVKKRR